MRADDVAHATLVALLLVAIVAVACRARREGFDGVAAGGPTPPFRQNRFNPYDVMHERLGQIRGERNDGYGQPALYELPRGLDRYHRAGADLLPRDIERAERDMWFGATPEGASPGSFNTELTSEPATETFAVHTPSPALNYQEVVTDLAVDPRTRESHMKWVQEMEPWSGTAKSVDNLDMETTLNFQGLRRPQAVVQNNPMMLTEITTEDLAVNPKFNFRG
jgi:hypothetical protein